MNWHARVEKDTVLLPVRGMVGTEVVQAKHVPGSTRSGLSGRRRHGSGGISRRNDRYRDTDADAYTDTDTVADKAPALVSALRGRDVRLTLVLSQSELARQSGNRTSTASYHSCS